MMITVLLPTYNSAKYLFEAIQSILNQTYQDFEFLIIDDGSTDNTKEIINGFSDRRIKYIEKTHTGLADTLNYGMQIAKNDWIARMDSDDISHPKRLELQIEWLETHPEVDWISCWYAVFDRKIKYIYKIPEKSDEIVQNLVLSSSICFPASIFKKEKVWGNGGFHGDVFEDYELLLRLKDELEFYNIQKVLFYQRRRPNSLSKGNLGKQKPIIYNVQKKYYENLKNEFGITNNNKIITIKGWREYFYGSKTNALNYWNKLNIKLILFPVTFLGYSSLLIPNRFFIYSKKFFFRLLLFYSPFKSSKQKEEFKQLKTKIFNRKKINIYGIELNLIKEVDLLNFSMNAVHKRKILNIICVDFRHLLYIKNDKLFVATPDNYFFYPDSSGIWILLKIFYSNKLNKFKRIVSTNFHYKLLKLANEGAYSVFLLGDTTETLKKFINKINNEFKNIKISGFANGFENLEQQDLIEKINVSNSDILLIGLGVPQQENWLIENAEKLNIPLRITVGAFFTFYSGKIKRAPKIFSKLYLEWFYRLIMEPKRLFYRYFYQFPKVLLLIAGEKWKK